MITPVELVLTCGSWQEAQRIADRLLEHKLVACVEMLDVAAHFRWQNEINTGKEVKLIMTTAEHLYGQIETEVKRLHSYETFVLRQLPVTHLNETAKVWLAEVIKN